MRVCFRQSRDHKQLHWKNSLQQILEANQTEHVPALRSHRKLFAGNHKQDDWKRLRGGEGSGDRLPGEIEELLSNQFVRRFILQNAKKELISAFHREELGNWLKKPIEQDQFPLLTNEKWLVSADDDLRTLFTLFLFLFLSTFNDNGNGTNGRQFSDSLKLFNMISTNSGNNNNNNKRSSSRIRIPMILALECYLLE